MDSMLDYRRVLTLMIWYRTVTKVDMNWTTPHVA